MQLIKRLLWPFNRLKIKPLQNCHVYSFKKCFSFRFFCWEKKIWFNFLMFFFAHDQLENQVKVGSISNMKKKNQPNCHHLPSYNFFKSSISEPTKQFKKKRWNFSKKTLFSNLIRRKFSTDGVSLVHSFVW